MNLTRRHLLCAPLLAAFPAIANAGAAPLRMVVIELMPWAGRRKDGQLDGAAVDMAALLSSISGLPIVTRAVPYARAIAMLASGDADLMLAVDATAEAGLPAPLATVGAEDVVIIGKRGARHANPDELCGHQVALLRRARFALSLPSCVRRYETSSYEQGLHMLLQGRLDGVAGVRATMDYAIRHLGLKAADLDEALVIGQANISLYLSAKAAAMPAVAARLQQACRQVQRQKKMPALIAQYRQQRD